MTILLVASCTIPLLVYTVASFNHLFVLHNQLMFTFACFKGKVLSFASQAIPCLVFVLWAIPSTG